MKILTLNANLREVGTYRRCYYFSRALAACGHDVTMVTVSQRARFKSRTLYKRDFARDFDVPEGPGPWIRMIEGPHLGYKWLPGWGSGPLDIAGRLRRVLLEGYEVIYGFEYHPNVSWPVYAARPFRTFAFYSDWCDWYGGNSNQLRGWRVAQRIDTFLEERIRFLGRRVTVTSKVLEQRALALGLPSSHVVRIPEGVDTDYCRPLPAAETRRRLGYPSDRPVLLSVNDGDMSRVVRIFQLVLKRCPEALLVIVGKMQARARDLAKEIGITGSVRFAGWVSTEDYPAHIACADACLVPLEDSLNNRARWPAKVLDFLAAGRPVVTNDVGEVGDLLRQRKIGLLTGQAPEEMAEGAVALLRDRDRRDRLGENARRVMVEEWDWRRRAEQIAAVVASTKSR